MSLASSCGAQGPTTKPFFTTAPSLYLASASPCSALFSLSHDHKICVSLLCTFGFISSSVILGNSPSRFLTPKPLGLPLAGPVPPTAALLHEGQHATIKSLFLLVTGLSCFFLDVLGCPGQQAVSPAPLLSTVSCSPGDPLSSCMTSCCPPSQVTSISSSPGSQSPGHIFCCLLQLS